MKKILVGILSLMLVMSGCSSKPQATKEGEKLQVESENETMETDVVVIGGGGAGMAAAISAHDAGAKVIVLEKMPFPGGNTVRAKGGLNAADTSVQAKLGIKDTTEQFYEDTMKGGKEINNPELVKVLSDNSAETVDWLISIGMDLNDVGMGAGATNARMHRPTGGKDVGPVLVDALNKNIESRGIELLVNTTVTEILREGTKVTGVKATTKDGQELTVKADAVVIATGGFAANEEMFSKYREDLKGFITTNHPGATGDGIILAEKLGAKLVDIEQIQTNPTVEQKTTEVISESVRGKGAIFVNQSGVRFTSEMLTRDVLSAKILEQPEKYAYIIFDQQLRDNMSAVDGMIERGIVTEGATIAELAEKIGMDAKMLEATLATWNSSVAAKNDAEFGRDTGMDNDLTKAPYYAIKVAPGVHHTMGGIKINAKTQVIGGEDMPIEALYACGEVTGGVHGANRLGGNAVSDIMTFGKLAGKVSAEYALQNGSLKAEGGAKAAPAEEKVAPKEGVTANFKDGSYSATAAGNNGDVTIDVVIEGGFITEIKAGTNSETGPIFATVEKDLFRSIIENQSVEVDTIAGATNSSKAVLGAVGEILASAK